MAAAALWAASGLMKFCAQNQFRTDAASCRSVRFEDASNVPNCSRARHGCARHKLLDANNQRTATAGSYRTRAEESQPNTIDITLLAVIWARYRWPFGSRTEVYVCFLEISEPSRCLRCGAQRPSTRVSSLSGSHQKQTFGLKHYPGVDLGSQARHEGQPQALAVQQLLCQGINYLRIGPPLLDPAAGQF